MNTVEPLSHVHIKVVDILEFISEFIGDTPVVGNDHTAVILTFIKHFRQSTHYVRKTSGLYKRNTFACHKKNILHSFCLLKYLGTVNFIAKCTLNNYYKTFAMICQAFYADF